MAVVTETIDTLLDRITDDFELSDYFFLLAPQSKKIINIWLKNVDHKGLYFDKYTLDVYEVSAHDRGGVLVGCKVSGDWRK